MGLLGERPQQKWQGTVVVMLEEADMKEVVYSQTGFQKRIICFWGL